MKTNVILDQILKYDFNQLILVDLLYQDVNRINKTDRKIFNVYLARLTKKGLIERLHRGVYYRAKDTKIGKTKPNLFKETVLIHTQNYNGFFGHETLLNILGLKNEIPRKLTIYTNELKRNKYVDKRVKLKKIDVLLNEENINYIEIITLLNDISKTHFQSERLYTVLAKYMVEKGLEFDKFLDYIEDNNHSIFKFLIPLKRAYNYETTLSEVLRKNEK